MGKDATRVRRRERKNIASGVAHVNSSFNNTTITITDAQGNTIAWSSAGEGQLAVPSDQWYSLLTHRHAG
jgi:ribosomal protein S11